VAACAPPRGYLNGVGTSRRGSPAARCARGRASAALGVCVLLAADPSGVARPPDRADAVTADACARAMDTDDVAGTVVQQIREHKGNWIISHMGIKEASDVRAEVVKAIKQLLQSTGAPVWGVFAHHNGIRDVGWLAKEAQWRVRVLDVSHNPLDDFLTAVLSALAPTLEHARLSHCWLTVATMPKAPMKQLAVLILSNSRLQGWPAALTREGVPSLVLLDLSNNALTTVATVSAAPSTVRAVDVRHSPACEDFAWAAAATKRRWHTGPTRLPTPPPPPLRSLQDLPPVPRRIEADQASPADEVGGDATVAAADAGGAKDTTRARDAASANSAAPDKQWAAGRQVGPLNHCA